MKRFLALLLALLLLTGCGPAAPAKETAAPQAELSALTGDTVLFYTQADFNDRKGTLVPLDTVRSAPAEELLPRTHLYDDRFPGDGALLLRLLDYAAAHGCQGFSVVSGTVPAPNADQFCVLNIAYRIDYGKLRCVDRDGVTTVWWQYYKDDAAEKFAEGLAAARKIAAQAPRGSEWETVSWIYTYLADHITYGDRNTYYQKHGNQLRDALVEGECVCSGYCDAMYYLCSLCGVECLGVDGNSDSDLIPGGVDGHAWNLARVDGLWYCFDPTVNDYQPVPGVSLCFGLSTDALQTLGRYQLTGAYTDETLIPACEACFDPVAVWNGSPEGALKSWLWYAVKAETLPVYLLTCSGMANPGWKVEEGENGEGITDLPYGPFLDWTLRFMSEGCAARFIPSRYRSTEDGYLSILPGEDGSGIDWGALAVRSVTAKDGTYTADLGAASAVFTVSEESGVYRIETIDVTPNK